MYSYITILSNWLLGYDKYSNTYSKSNIAKSTFPDVFYILNQDELSIGLDKAHKLLDKVNHENGLIRSNNAIIKINTQPAHEVFKNTRNGRGWFIESNTIPVLSVELYQDGTWLPISIEDATALSYKLCFGLKPYSALSPRTLSFLPVGAACQAKCLFCFSESSISLEQKRTLKDFPDLDAWCYKAKNAGAERFVITGGGEPGILKEHVLLDILGVSSSYFTKNILISNGLFLSGQTKDTIKNKLEQLKNHGLSVLSLSYHHYEAEMNKTIMGIDTKIETILKAYQECDKNIVPKIRLICVLQKSGIHNKETFKQYLSFAMKYGITEICFKELYVSSTHESLYSNTKENQYCLDNQVMLSTIKVIVESMNSQRIAELPWGSPIYEVKYNGSIVNVALYTEPSVGWERTTGIARSWNYMADNKCYASLEDTASQITIGE